MVPQTEFENIFLNHHTIWIKFYRLNRWNDQINVTTAESLDTPPDYTFYKSSDIATIKGTIFGSNTIITNHNLNGTSNFNFPSMQKKCLLYK